MAVMLIPAHEYCVLCLFAIIGWRYIKLAIRDPFGKWLFPLWICVVVVDVLTVFDKLEDNSIFYFLSGCALSLLLPLVVLFVRKYHLRQPFHRGDVFHLAPLVVWVIATFVLHFIPVPDSVTYRLAYEIFGYVISSSYILLLLVFYYQNIGSSAHKKMRNTSPPVSGKKTQPFSAVHVRQIVAAIETAMTSGTAYLQQKYSLTDLANETGIPTHQLSAFINSYYHMNFNDFINKHRIEYFKKRLAEDPAWQSLTLEGIAKDAGFGNRNTFTKAFKKLHGTTPGEFLKSIKERAAD